MYGDHHCPDPINSTMEAVTEDELLARATGLPPALVALRRQALTETERNVLGLQAPLLGPRLRDGEIGRRLGLRPRQVRQVACSARAKLDDPSTRALMGALGQGAGLVRRSGR